MIVLARKKGGIGFMYLAVVIFSVIYCIKESDLISRVFLGLFGVFALVVFIQYIILPKDIIRIDSKKILYLPKGITLNPKDIVDVSYKRASAKGLQYKWGSVTIKTVDSKYKYGYIADCESVAKNIYDLMCKSKNENVDFSL